MSAARKALEALEAARSDATGGAWQVNEGASFYHGKRRVDEYYVYSPSVCDDVGIASSVIDPTDGTPSKPNADLIALSVNLSAPLAAVVRAAMEYRDAWAAFVAFRGAETHRVLLLRRAAQFAALDAFDAAARAQGFA